MYANKQIDLGLKIPVQFTNGSIKQEIKVTSRAHHDGEGAGGGAKVGVE
jgi:hypothetical protein